MATLVVALVSPSEPLRRPLADALVRAGYIAVDGATTAEVAAGLAGRAPVALVLDLGFPSASPAALVQDARDVLGEELLIVGLTSFYTSGRDRDGWTQHVSTFLPRPADPGELLATLRDFLDPTADSPPPRRRVLLADDDAILLRLSASLLELRGWEVVTARDGQEALERAIATRPDAIVSDILMPGLDGYHLCMAVRKHPLLATTPVILFTGNFVEEQDRARAQSAAATAFVVKSDTLAEVFAHLDNIGDGRPAVVEIPRVEAVEADWSARLQRQVVALASRNLDMVRRAALRDAELSALSAIAAAFGQRRPLPVMLSEVLGIVAAQGDLAFALLFLPDADGVLEPRGMTGRFAEGGRTLPPEAAMERVLQGAVAAGEPVAVPRGGAEEAEAERAVLAALGVSSVLLCPLRLQGRSLGVLVLAAEQRDLSAASWRAYGGTVALHLALALTLYRSSGAPRPDERAAARERLAGDLRSLGALLDGVLPGDSAARGLLPALHAARPGPLDLHEPLAVAFPDHALPAGPLPAEGAANALGGAFSALRDALGGGPIRVNVLEADGGWAIRLQAPADAGGAPRMRDLGDARLREIGTEIVRRHGGDVSDRSSPGARVLLVRLPRGD